MRLNRLALTRYGIFTDRVLDFGEPIEDEPDLHVVYGPNESGKSTALAGFLDLLFAFEHRSPYGFAHGYDAMRVEADLAVGGAARRLVRVRKRHGSLLDESGGPVSDDLLTNALGGMSRDTYRAMFSLDDDSLEAGGEEILRSEGDLGRLLFATGAGLVELSGSLDRLRDDAQEFHRARSRSTGLHALKARLDELEQEKKRLDTAASAYARLVADRDEASRAYDDAMARRSRLEADRETAQRHLEGLRRLAEIRPLRAELAELEALPEAPRAWFAQIGDLIADEPKLGERVKGLRERERGLNEEKEALVPDDGILELEDRIGSLDRARARYVTAEDDLLRRRASLAEDVATIAAVVRRLDKSESTEPRSLLIPTATVGELNELIERRSGIEERLKTASHELDTAGADARAAAAAVEEVSGEEDAEDGAVRRLTDTMEEIRSDDFGTRLRLHGERRRGLQAELDGQLAQFHPWSGGAEGLARIRIPAPQELQEWGSILDEARRDIERVERDRAGLVAERDRLSERIGRQAAEAGVVGDDDARRLRALRDEAWSLHRAALDEETADRFEERLKEDDAATAGRLAHAAELAGLRQAAEDLLEVEAKLERSGAELALAQDKQRSVLDRIAAAVAEMGRTGAEELPPDIPLARLTGWLERRAAILDTLARVEHENTETDRARQDADLHKGRLVDAMAAAGLEHDPDGALEDLLHASREAVELHSEKRTTLSAARERLDTARADLDRRERGERRAGADDAAWREKWAAALSGCWLQDVEPIPSTGAVRRILEDVALLESTLASRDQMSERVNRMEGDQAAYAEVVRFLVERLGGSFEPQRVLEQGDALGTRLAKAIADRTAREGVVKKIGELSEQIEDAENRRAQLRAVAQEMFETFGVDSLRAVEESLGKVARRETLRKDLTERETGLVEAMKAATVDEVEAVLADASQEGLQAGIAELEARLEDTTQRTRELYHRLENAREAVDAIGGDEGVARLEGQRRTCILEIQERAVDYVRIRIGVEAAERALRVYRDEHRSTMMEHASEAFRTISRGAYDRLESQLTDKGEVLIGIAAGGGAKIASQMSKGARFQLYLALRMAGYREFVDRHGPVPFIADDILETSDDFRAKEAFRLFADLATAGQVIYLGHHRHLCDIAREVCPGVRIHELPDPVEAAAENGRTRSG